MKEYPKRCWQGDHVKGCCPGKPKCRWNRKLRDNRRVCECDGYEFPHRRGSGCCVHGKDYVIKQWERNTGIPWKEE